MTNSATIQVTQPGMMTSVQDAGRWGYQRFGVPVCGVRDQLARRIANLLVGNRPNTPVLEANITGPSFVVHGAPVLIALCGSNHASLDIDGTRVPAQQSVLVHPGETVVVTPWGDSACVTLAIGGCIDVPMVMGSASTYLRGGFGGFQGRKLAAGDSLALGQASAQMEKCCQQAMPYGSGPLPIVLGPQDDHFPAHAIETLTATEYRVTNDCDRMGTRLDGDPIEHLNDFNITSDAMAAGSVQIPGGQTPIIMGPDRGTVGGYAKIGTLASTAMSRFGRLKPRDTVRFAVQSPDQALADLRAKEVLVRRMMAQLVPAPAR